MNKFIIHLLRIIVNLGWYVLLPLLLIAGLFTGYKIWMEGYLDRDVPVMVNNAQLPAAGLKVGAHQVMAINNMEGVLKVKMKLNALLICDVVFFYGLTVALLAGILLNLRRILRSLKENRPFIFENIRRLRYVSLFIFSYALAGFLNGLFNSMMLGSRLREAGDHYWVKVELGWAPVLFSLSIFVLSEIFRQGYTLKTDNESII